jgi:hypothetical protein
MRFNLLKYILLFLLFLTVYLNLPDNKPTIEAYSPSKEFYAYWYDGFAEINKYELHQSRYGETRTGEAVMIFVTEDFLPDQYIKTDQKNDISVLKCHLIKEFKTGVYPYRMMLSVFNNVNEKGGFPIKTAASVSEWCGQSYAQLLRKNGSYEFTNHTYLGEKSNDLLTLPLVFQEDGVWNSIRLHPENLFQGKAIILQGLFQQRIRLLKNEPAEAVFSLEKNVAIPEWIQSNSKLNRYTISCDKNNSVLNIYFEAGFPNKIAGWEEEYPEKTKTGFVKATTRAVLTSSEKMRYWMKNSLKDSNY